MSLTRSRRRPGLAAAPAPASVPSAVRRPAKTDRREKPPEVTYRGNRDGQIPALLKEKAETRATPNWQRTDRWFWLGEGELTGQRLLVVPQGETFEMGPMLMTSYRTQDGQVKSCSVEYFEKNTELAKNLRPVR